MTNECISNMSKRVLLNALILFGCLFPVSHCRAQWHQTGLKEWTNFLLPFESSDVLACTRLGILRSSDAGITWMSVGYGLIYPNVQSAALRKISPSLYYLFAGTEGGAFRLIFPNFSEWLLTSQWLPQDAVTSMIVVDTLMFATTGRSGVYVTSDNGAHWLSRNTGLPDPNPFIPRTSSLTWLDGYLFIGAIPGLYRSSDMGGHWSLSNTGITAQQVNCLTSVQNVLYAGTENGVFRSSNYGASWSESVGLTGQWIASLGTDGSTVFAGLSKAQVFLLRPQGESWIEVSESLAPDASPINSIVVTASTVYLGTGNGVWARPYSDVTSVHGSSGEVAQGFELDQNYPNPFNPTTRIKYTIGGNRGEGVGNRDAGAGDLGLGTRRTTLVVYDILGREVAVLVNEKQAAGTYEVTFDASRLTSGVYFYRLQAGDFTETKKLCLIQ